MHIYCLTEAAYGHMYGQELNRINCLTPKQSPIKLFMHSQCFIQTFYPGGANLGVDNVKEGCHQPPGYVAK